MTETKPTNKLKLTSIIGFLLPFVIILGNTSVGGVRIAGIVLTYYRVIIPLLFLAGLFLNNGYPKTILSRRSFECRLNASAMAIVLAIWTVYGFVTIALFPYATVHEGLQEIMALILGAMLSFCILSVCAAGGRDSLLIGTKVVLYITLAIGLYELLTANHLSTARVCDPDFIQMNKEIFGEEADELKFYIAMSVFHNENDFSAMIAVMTPFIIWNADKGRLLRTLDNIAMCISLVILYQNNAFIAFVAFVLGTIVCVLIGVRTKKEKIGIVGFLVGARIVAGVVNRILGNSVAGMSATLAGQIDTNAAGAGSMFLRINTYKTTLVETFVTSKGLGFGAGSFTNYFSPMAESKQMLLNPHCFWLEILSEYGLLVFTLFIAFLVVLMIGLLRNRKKEDNLLAGIVCASGVALIIASVAPSSFLKAGYYWIPIALAVYLTDDWKMRKRLKQ